VFGNEDEEERRERGVDFDEDGRDVEGGRPSVVYTGEVLCLACVFERACALVTKPSLCELVRFDDELMLDA
jgi:hypothetical protein